MQRIYNIGDSPVEFEISGTVYTVMPLTGHFKKVRKTVQYAVDGRGKPKTQVVSEWVRDEEAEKAGKRPPNNHCDIPDNAVVYLRSDRRPELREVLKFENEIESHLKNLESRIVEDFKARTKKYDNIERK